ALEASLSSLRSPINPRGLKLLTSAPIRVLKPLASKFWITPKPLMPTRKLAQVSGALLPTGVTIPTPVIATLRRAMLFLRHKFDTRAAHQPLRVARFYQDHRTLIRLV